MRFLRNSDSEFSPASDLSRCSVLQGVLGFVRSLLRQCPVGSPFTLTMSFLYEGVRTRGNNSQRVFGIPFLIATQGLTLCSYNCFNIAYNIVFVILVL